MNTQETYLLKLIEKVERVEQSIGKLEQIKEGHHHLLQQLKKTELEITESLNYSSRINSQKEESIRKLEDLLNSVPRSIPKPIVFKVEKGSFLEISKSFLLLFVLFSVLFIGTRWIQFQYFDSYVKAWDLAGKNQSQAWKNHMAGKLKEVQNQSFWKKIKE